MLNDNSRNRRKIEKAAVRLIVAIVVAILAFVLLKNLFWHDNKTVSCTTNVSTMGIAVNSETIVKISDGKIVEGDITVNVNLEAIQENYLVHEKEIMDEMTGRYHNRCKDGCVFNHEYTEGKNAKYTLIYSGKNAEDIVQEYEVSGASTQEVADSIQAALDNMDTVCVQY